MTTVDDMQDVLQSFGVDLANPMWRREKAVAMVNANVEPEEAEALFRHVERTTPDRNHVPGAIAALALDPTRVREGIRSLAGFVGATAARQGTADLPAAPGPLAGEDRAQWARLRNRAMAYGSVVADRKPIAKVADEMGLSVKVVEELLSEEHASRGIEAKKGGRRMVVVADEETESQRRQRFITDMRAKRLESK